MTLRAKEVESGGDLKKNEQRKLFEAESEELQTAVTCLGNDFDSAQARRRYYLQKLREALGDSKFRDMSGFPKGSVEDILRLSDPPYYTACPNPFLEDFLRVHGKQYDPKEEYSRAPFAVDVSVGKTDPLYKAHSYHTKVPHLAIVPLILHYTKPGDVVLDAFCGSGLAGVAAQWCATSPPAYRKQVEGVWRESGHGRPDWGLRHVILGDLGPAPAFLAACYNMPFDVCSFEREAQHLLDILKAEIGWMYKTLHTDGQTKAMINYTVWSEVFSCPVCSGEVTFLEEALDTDTHKTRRTFSCPHCDVQLKKNRLERSFETFVDPATGIPWKRIRLRPVRINYSVGKACFEKTPDEGDLETLRKIAELPLPPEVPTAAFPIQEMYHGSRLAPKGFTHVHHMFLPRAAQALALLWRGAAGKEDARLRNALFFFIEQAIWGMSVLARYAPTHYSQVNQYLNGVYYVGSQIVDVSPWYILDGKLRRLGRAFRPMPTVDQAVAVTTGDCGEIPISDNSIDYIFTDPPFGANIYYADLNFLVESWHRVLTDAAQEAIVDPPKRKGVHEYQELMRRCFREYYRVLKPGRWMTVVFSNSSNAIWRAIQEAIGTGGFVVADVRSLDKGQGSYRQVTSSAVKQDLVISAYKPVREPRHPGGVTDVGEESAWSFVAEHLSNLPVFVSKSGNAEVVVERTPQMLLDKMIAFHVQRGLSVPIDSRRFFAGLAARYRVQDGMCFLPDQIDEYNRKRITVRELRQLVLIPRDEATAIQWLRQQIERRPQRQQDLTPLFHKEIHGWEKHERTIDIRDLLEQNFLCYDGRGPIPGQIVSYLKQSSAWRPKIQAIEEHLGGIGKEGLATRDGGILSAAKNLWYIPDPSRQVDLEMIRERQLLREFDEYKSARGHSLHQFRTEAVRAGFKAAYDARDYQTILEVGNRLPAAVLQEDEKLLMYYDVASMRLGED